MRFTTIVSSLAAVAVANSAAVTPARSVPNFQGKYTIDLEAASCSALECVEVVAAAGCIALGIADRKLDAVLGCVSGATGKLCGCAGCIDALGDFLSDNNVC